MREGAGGDVFGPNFIQKHSFLLNVNESLRSRQAALN
jgi:hypothetical protein